MASTYPDERDESLRRWLRRWLVLDEPVLSDEARDLLRTRRQLRRRANVRVAPLIVLTVALLLDAGYGDWSDPTHPQWSVAVAFVTGVLAVAIRTEDARRGDLRAARSLTHRISRSSESGPTTLLGLGTIAGLLTAAMVTIAMTMVLSVDRPHASVWVFAASTTFGWLFAAFGVGRARSRPAVAADLFTLTVDDRLRSSEANTACVPLGFALGFFDQMHEQSGSLMMFLTSTAPTLVIILVMSGSPRNRYRRRPGSDDPPPLLVTLR